MTCYGRSRSARWPLWNRYLGNPGEDPFGGNIIHKLLAVGAAAVFQALWAMAASADETTGTITEIDHIKNIFVVDGVPYAAAPNNTTSVSSCPS